MNNKGLQKPKILKKEEKKRFVESLFNAYVRNCEELFKSNVLSYDNLLQ